MYIHIYVFTKSVFITKTHFIIEFGSRISYIYTTKYNY